MDSDAKIALDGQSFQLSRIQTLMNPLRLLINESDAFKFSIESTTDVSISNQDSGAYCMNIDQMTAETDPIMLLKEVQVT
mmetsp:Transcript_27483/g.36751  ORF Transcript_27483/g.36751 Transcript_27483/m.36751 type:complete len:80 (+) Transcript_27483:71-310(+)